MNNDVVELSQPMQFRSELEFDTYNGMPHSYEQMQQAVSSNWVHPDFRDGTVTVDKLLDNVDVVLDWYLPSVDSIDFMNFIRLVLGEEPENTNPKAHYFLIDCIFRNDNVRPYFQVRNIDFEFLSNRIVVLCTREFSKSTILGTMLVLYIAAKGTLPGFGRVNYVLYVADSMRNNVKTTMETIGSVYQESEYLRSIFEDATTNQDEVSFVRKPVSKKDIALYDEYVNKQGLKPSEVPGRAKRTFSMKGIGAATGGRGSRDGLFRPDMCHKKGTVVYTDIGEHLVEDYYKTGNSRLEHGKIINVAGLPNTEVVTKEHRYWCKNFTLTEKEVAESEEGWIEAKDMTPMRTYIGSDIDMAIEEPKRIETKVPEISKRDSLGHIISTKYVDTYVLPNEFLDEDFWWIYGLWLGDGHISKNKFGLTIAYSEEHTIGKKVLEYISKNNLKYYRSEAKGCYQIIFNNTIISNWLKKYKKGISVKDMPDWVLRIDPRYQKQILIGYIDADGYIDKKGKQVRINSVNYNVLKQLGVIALRLGLPYHIRNTKKATISKFPGNIFCNTRHQWEIRFKKGINNILGYKAIDESSRNRVDEVHISDGKLWRKVKFVSDTEQKEEFIPIQTPSHVYSTEFGISHNCIFDDMISSESDATSDVVLGNIDSTIESDVLKALSGNGNFAILIGTPYNKKDPVYKRVENKQWLPIVFPKAERMDETTTEETFRGVWPDRHTYKQCFNDFIKAKMSQDAGDSGPMRSLKQEYYLRISSEEDRMISDSMINWFSRADIVAKSWSYNWYITTDFTTTGNKGSDLSCVMLWAVDSNQNHFLVDLTLRKMEVETQYNETFAMAMQTAGKTRWVEVGVEIDGQQSLHILSLKDRMPKKNFFFTFARQKGSKPGAPEGIRSSLERGNKHWRFRMTLPMFQNNKIWFAKELKETPDMRELLDEIKYCSYSGIGSKHDDGLDGISQLLLINMQYPAAGEDYGSPVVDVSHKNKKRTILNSKIWGDDSYDEDEYGAVYDSYI